MEPEAIRIDEKEPGMRIPGTFVFRCDVFNPVTRTQTFEALQEFVTTSLRQGDNVYVHCVSGMRRSVIVATLLSAILMGITLESAMDIINQSRNVEFHMHTGRQWNIRYESMEGLWMDEMHRQHLDRVDSVNAVIHVISDSEEIDNRAIEVLHAASSIQSSARQMHSRTSSLAFINALGLETTAAFSRNSQEVNPGRLLPPLQPADGYVTRPDAA